MKFVFVFLCAVSCLFSMRDIVGNYSLSAGEKTGELKIEEKNGKKSLRLFYYTRLGESILENEVALENVLVEENDAGSIFVSFRAKDKANSIYHACFSSDLRAMVGSVIDKNGSHPWYAARKP